MEEEEEKDGGGVGVRFGELDGEGRKGRRDRIEDRGGRGSGV